MSGVNKAIIVGHIGKAPEIRRTQSGNPVATFSVATSQSWRDKASGERKEATQWHRVVVFNEGLCKVVEQYARKGSKVYVEGMMITRKWTGQDGLERSTTEIVLQNFNSSLVLLDRAERAAPEQADYGIERGGSASGAAPASNDGGSSSGKSSDMDDDIPF